MQIEVKTLAAHTLETPALILPVWQDEPLNGLSAQIDRETGGLISQLTEDGFRGKTGEIRILYQTPGVQAARIVLVGLGKREKWGAANLRKAASLAARAARGIKRKEIAFLLDFDSALNAQETAAATVEGTLLGLYRFDDFKTDAETEATTEIKKLTLLVSEEEKEQTQTGADLGQVVSEANIRARGWVNRPSNLKSPQYLAQQAEEIAAKHALQCEIWDENRLREERMNALLGVGMGSHNPPRLIRLEYTPENSSQEQPLILVGKGVTFDTGGYSLKPAASMEEMKDDMAGAAVVLAAMEAVARLKLNRRIIGLIGSVENMVSGTAQRPGDIVTARNGKTIEILNTDAEGRLVLADVLSYASELSPSAIIDFATLTGAIGIALGTEAAGLFSNDDTLTAQVCEAGEKSGERVWPFPMWDEYKEHVKGKSSDLKNIGQERRAGSISAAAFLENFVGDGIPWAHIDIAAVAYLREERPLSAYGATGFGVRLAVELLNIHD